MYLLLDIFGYLSVVLRGLILIAQSFTLGGLVFWMLLWAPLRPQLTSGGLTIELRCRAVLRISALAWALLTIASLALNAAALVGTLQVAWSEALGADFGRADLVIAACAFGIAVLAKNPAQGVRSIGLVALAVLALAMQTRLTHAASRPDVRWPLLLSDAGHMLGASVWIGGLPYFLIALSGCEDSGDWRRIARRYSLMSMAAVAAILAGGLTMAVTYIGSIEAIYGTAYGVMTLAKVGLLLMLLALGAGNYFLVERLRRDPSTPILRLKRFAEVEIGIGLTVLLAAASLTSLPPGVDLAQDRLNWHEIVERATPQWPPRLTSPDYDKLTVAQLQAKITLADAGRANAQAAYVPGEGTILPRNAEDIAWSEYNHHWAGIFVVLIGLLALIEHFRWGRWAKHWPLLFLGMAAFLFFRADEQAWPLGPAGFFESLRDPEVAQHRIFVLLIAVFGIFEWRVRLRGGKAGPAALVFPLTTALGGALLLTHSHSIANIKDQLLIEMSHTPLALCGVTAGWARWLELRMDGRVRQAAAWIWPIAFVLVGLILLEYREA
ncbi:MULTISPECIES: copper resistance D family protein [Bradyrhizobium]|uniref:copper resistance D family protein n=1 Tax=Bradyrhizobium TaxID=374 RepID=UPI000231D94C|nr:CopD family protein [Bradyrhizobium japonicum]AJA64836.1 copper resistance protein [Bradyrhizobium japonicum]KMJ97464.1 copper resistance protein [Bradyrhizobium japonicum]MBR0764522.1 CopD family protein [Bradyrhizobium japonicum]MCS3538198.1 putative copper resistance protein D [Bradyrhizobium japonicum]MCS3985715.1 putative copper resistance protein D [Bradyrhizobium japonicum]